MTMHKKNMVKRSILSLLILSAYVSLALFFPLKSEKTPQTTNATDNYPIYGIDVSKHTDRIDWAKVKAQDIRFAYLKATEGATYLDPKFKEFYQGAKDNGVLVSAYHFFRFEKSGAEQADNFIRNVDISNLDLIPVLDVEEAVGYNRTKNVAPVVREIRTFLEIIEEKYGIKMILYSNEQGYNKYIRDYFPNHEIWICALKQQPSIEKGWLFWQYSHTTKLDGVRYPVDMNIYYGNYEAWDNYVQNSTLALRGFKKQDPLFKGEELSLLRNKINKNQVNEL